MKSGFVFNTMHIDVARNATDDFNLFHDKLKWSEIRNNPFGGPIVLGFQLLGLIADKFFDYRQENNEYSFIKENKLDFSYYQLKFANVVKPEQSVSLDIKSTQIKTSPELQLSNRYSLKADNGLVVAGFKKELSTPNILTNIEIPGIEQVHNHKDRSFLRDENFFVKHKYFNTSKWEKLFSYFPC